MRENNTQGSIHLATPREEESGPVDAVRVRVKKLVPGAQVPTLARHGDAAFDLYAVEDCDLPPGEWRAVRTGIALEIPEGYEGQVRARSGLALEEGISVLNGPGTIDSGYRGEVKVILINHGNTVFRVRRGMRVGQLAVRPVPRVELELVETLSESERGAGGFGSTGR